MVRRRNILLWLILPALLLSGGAAWWWTRQHAEPVVRHVPRRGGLDVTLLAASDTHFGSKVVGLDRQGRKAWINAAPVRRVMDDQMKRIAGKPYPQSIGGTVGPPASLVITGDLTEDGKPEEWRQFAEFYDLPAGQPEPKPTADWRPPGPGERMPVYECPGNHDKHSGFYVHQQVAARHGGDYYSIDYGDLHLASLSDGPDEKGLDWLKRDLAKTGRQRPVIIYMHYPLVGPFSDSWWGGKPELTESFAGIIAGFNIIAILHGHWHIPGHYEWNGVDVYNIGSIKHGARCFGVVHVTDQTFTFGSWNCRQDDWWWWHSKPINGHGGPAAREILDVQVKGGGIGRPAIPYPREP
jgi:hypothetical protein